MSALLLFVWSAAKFICFIIGAVCVVGWAVTGVFKLGSAGWDILAREHERRRWRARRDLERT